jgi:hypothetical protein
MVDGIALLGAVYMRNVEKLALEEVSQTLEIMNGARTDGLSHAEYCATHVQVAN